MKREKAQWKAGEVASTGVRRVLPGILHDYYKAGRKLDKESSAKDLHGFRLRTKRVRYLLESFLSVYGPSLKARIDLLRPIQNALGDLNDCEVLLASERKHLPKEIREWITGRADEKREEFLRYWREEFDAAGEDAKWEMCLSRPARTRSAA